MFNLKNSDSKNKKTTRLVVHHADKLNYFSAFFPQK